jgi:hypothetical protein
MIIVSENNVPIPINVCVLLAHHFILIAYYFITLNIKPQMIKVKVFNIFFEIQEHCI